MGRFEIKYTKSKGKLMKEELEKLEEHNVLHENEKFLKINNESREHSEAGVSWCKVGEGMMRYKLGMLTGRSEMLPTVDKGNCNNI
jgi:hypothetical protein